MSLAPESPLDASNRGDKVRKRSYVACRRCHSHKIKCSGGTPCRGCQNSTKPTECIYPNRSKKISVPDSYIKELEAENRFLRETAARSSKTSTTPADLQDQDHMLEQDVDTAGQDVVTPIFEDSVLRGRNNSFSSHVYIGDAACAAFGFRLRHSANGGRYSVDTADARFFDHPVFLRCSQTVVELPSRTYAKVLIQVVVRFVGADYHFLRLQQFHQNLEEVYASPATANKTFLCRLYGILALGELYSKKTPTQGSSVPGTAFFVQAIGLLQDQQETGGIDYIETLLTLSFYSLALNRVKTAYTYVGTALRLSLALGLHRNAPQPPGFTDEDIEHRRRVWWTAYTYDRLLTSKLGFPLTLRDDDIDAPLPSPYDSKGRKFVDFIDPSHLLATIRLSRITGTILNLIYSLPAPKKGVQFVLNVRSILTSLRGLDHDLPESLRGDVAFSCTQPRNVSSLRLHFNQCIILTTRPILLHVFRFYMQPQSPVNSEEMASPSATITALADACISAARLSHKRLIQLWIDGNLATFGYFDAHYLFSCLTILCIACKLFPNSEDADAVETGTELLKSMSQDGNTPASEYYDRLLLIRSDLDERKRPLEYSAGSQHETAKHHGQAQGLNSASTPIPGTAVEDLRPSVLAGTDAPLEDPSLQDFFLDTTIDWTQDILNLAVDQAQNGWQFPVGDFNMQM